MSSSWPAVSYETWSATCDTLHAHAQVLGKLAVELAPPEPQLQHAALRLTARGWETATLPTPDGSGGFGVGLDLRAHEVLVEHTGGDRRRIPLTPNRSVAEVTRDVLDAVRSLAGRVEINPKPQETPWQTPLDEDTEHATYDPPAVEVYFQAATQAAHVLTELRAPYRGRSTPVNAWWGTFDLAVSLFSGRPAEPASEGYIWRNAGNAEQIEVGWWPGDPKYPRAAFFGFAYPASDGLPDADVAPGRWDSTLGEYILDWDDVLAAPDPHGTALGFGRAVVRHACAVCDWVPELAASLEGQPPPVA
jgi:Family of unknown function (DUF5996)